MKRSRLLSVVSDALAAAGTPSARQVVVAALSGGADSVALVDALVEIGRRDGFQVVAAHLDHGLRPDSVEDAVFCLALGGRLGVEVVVGRADVAGRAGRDGSGLEEAGREERYAFLRRVARERGAAAIAVAHTANDQVETVLLRMMRGAGPGGLGAMSLRADDLLRPLLGVSRADVLEHLGQRGLAWREDPTNADTRILRNRVRHELLPYLEARFNPEIREALGRLAAISREESALLDEQGRALAERLVTRIAGAVVVDRRGLVQAPRALARRVLRQALAQAGGCRGVGFVHVENVLDLAAAPDASGRRRPLPGGRDAVISFDQVRLVWRRPPAETFSFPLAVPGRVQVPGGVVVSAERATTRTTAPGPETAVVAGADPLVVRTRQAGDHVRWHGREVSLRRFLQDARVPADDRRGLPLVAAGSRVVFIPGRALDPDPPGPCPVRLRASTLEATS